MNDLTNQIFGRLRVIHRAEDYVSPQGKHYTKWHCLCECGNEVDVAARGLVSGNTKSCGCIHKETMSKICSENRKSNMWTKSDDIYWFVDDNGIQGCISECDYERCKQYYWTARWNPHTKSYYFFSKINYKFIPMGRFILSVNETNKRVDHISHETTNNTRNNLRIVTNTENTMNRNINSNNTSGATGVNFEKSSGKWVARIQVNGKRIRLGAFDNLDKAIKARKEAEEKYFGEYSYDNSMRMANG